MLLKVGLTLLGLGFLSLPFYSHGGYVTVTTMIFMAGFLIIGADGFMKAEVLSAGIKPLYFVYRTAPLTLPLLAFGVRLVVMSLGAGRG